MMRTGEAVVVDTGAWAALAQTRDPLHERARITWEQLEGNGAKIRTSVPVILETFTFLERNTTRDVALAWKDALEEIDRFATLECMAADMAKAWAYFRRKDLHKLSAVDATSFVLMTKSKIRTAFTFDHHFAAAGFAIVG
jgi:predicted nucleic acid-binding protein